MEIIRRQHVLVKLILYLLVVFVAGMALSVFLGLIIPVSEDVADWQFSLGYILAFILTAVIFITGEHNALARLREKALASQNNLSAIDTRIKNTLFELESLLVEHMGHESDIYLQISKDHSKAHPKLRTMGEIRSSLSEYPALRSDETVMRLFREITDSHNMLMNGRLSYNALASDYNAGIHKYPAILFQNMWHFSELPYLNTNTDSLVSDTAANPEDQPAVMGQ